MGCGCSGSQQVVQQGSQSRAVPETGPQAPGYYWNGPETEKAPVAPVEKTPVESAP